MRYNDFLREVVKAPGGNILVTGPQRSGTTLMARCIAHDLDLQYCDEDEIGWNGGSCNNENVLRQLLTTNSGYVIQAPACAHICHQLPPDTVVVFVRRGIAAIVKSQERIDWQYERVEADKYPPEFYHGCIAATKYAYWEQVQRDQIDYAFEVDYESLREHPLWVKDRKGFAARQWEK